MPTTGPAELTPTTPRWWPYAAEPLRAGRQAVADLAIAGWVWWWWQLGRDVEAAVARLAAPGTALANGASDLGGRLRDAGEQVARLPRLGDDLAAPFAGAGDAADAVAGAGRDQAGSVLEVADLLGWVVAAVPVTAGVLLWAPVRWRFVRRAAAARALLASGGAQELFALRALVSAEPLRLLRISTDPAGDWRRGDPEVMAALADLELRGIGVRSSPQAVGRT